MFLFGYLKNGGFNRHSNDTGHLKNGPRRDLAGFAQSVVRLL